MPAERTIHFGRYRLHPVQGLTRGRQELHVTPKSLALLYALAERPGQVVTKAELFRIVWPRVVVSDAALASCIRELRRALDDDARSPQYIETVHRRGYRFIGRTSTVAPDEAVPEPAAPARDPVHRAEPLVGRTDALGRLADALARARTGARQLVFVTGEPGIGKTALVEAFTAGIADRPDVRITYGQCVERHGAGEPYQPLLEALARLCRRTDGEQALAVLRRCAPSWLAQLPALQTDAELRTLRRRTAGVTPDRMLRELTDAFEALAAKACIVLVLEDLHWSDLSTLDWIAAFARRPDRACMLIVGTYRPSEPAAATPQVQTLADELRVKGLCRELPLAGLAAAEVAELVTRRHPPAAEARGPIDELARLVFRHTEGNPLFVVNVLRDLVARGLLVERDGAWTASAGLDAASLRVPEDIRRTIERQVDRLDPERRRLLEVASLCDGACSAAAIAAAAGTPVSEVESALGALARQGLFVRVAGIAEWPDGTVAASFEPIHALYREVLRERVPASRRAELHRAIGARLEAAYGERAAEIAAELAAHFEQARDARRAIVYLRHAADTARRRSANPAAQLHLRRALALLERLPASPGRDESEVALRIALGNVLSASGGFAAREIESCFRRAEELCSRLGRTPQLFPVLWGLWLFHLGRGPLGTARELADGLAEMARASSDPLLLLQAHHAQWATMFSMGDIRAAESHARAGIALYEPDRYGVSASTYGDHDPCVCARMFLARSAVLTGRTDTAVRAIDEAVAQGRELAHPFSTTLALVFAAFVHQARRDGEAARECAAGAAAMAREHGFALMHSWASVVEAWADVVSGRREPGLARMRDAVARAGATGSGLFQPLLVALLAETELACGLADDARTHVEEGFALAARLGDRIALSDLHRIRGELCAASESKARTAERELRRALDIAQAQGAELLALRAALGLGRLWRSTGRSAEARALVEAARGRIAEGAALPDLAEANALLAGL